MRIQRRRLFKPVRFCVVVALAVSSTVPAFAQPPGGRGRGGLIFSQEAPVPTAVAMARPSQEEAARAREILTQMIADLSAEDRALLFAYYTRQFIRQQVNWYEALSPAVIAGMDDHQRRLFGFGKLANYHGAHLVLRGDMPEN